MSKLNQVIAIEKDVKNRAHSVISEYYKIVQKPDLFNGQFRTYRKKDEDGEDLPAEKKQVQFKVDEMFAHVANSQATLFDVTMQKDKANAIATASVMVDGQLLIADVPVTTLLFLEKQLTDLRTFIGTFPVLDNAETWNMDENADLYRSDPIETHRTKKLQKPIVLYDATKEHPAQTAMINEDVIAGWWVTEKISGAMPKRDKERMLARCETLLLAIKEAREAANSIDAGDKPKLGQAVFSYLQGV